MSNRRKSKREQVFEQAAKDGTLVVYNTPDDMKEMEKVNKIMEAVRADFKERDRKSHEEAKRFVVG